MRSHSQPTPRSLAASLAVLALPFALACFEPTATRYDEQVGFFDLEAPATVAAPGPLMVNVRVFHGACHRNIRLIRTATPGLVTLVARAEYYMRRGNFGCPDRGEVTDTTITVPAAAPGPLTVRAIQLGDQPPMDVIVNVTPN
jgi:hypothetical protein